MENASIQKERADRKGPADNRAVARAYIEAFGQKRWDDLEELLHPEIEFKSPNMTLNGSHEVMDSIRRLAPVLLQTEVKRIFVEGDEAFVRYDIITNTSAGPVSTVELLKIEDGLVRSAWLLFDQQAWSAALEEAAKRPKT